ncbi:MAG TPA: efflux RND transporter periplasmic adaptor subunit [Chthoniobacterales bacterium]|nr:efflux RND transporter periplasmic adaptor subunit [Chthoniobacterales bacterium]
MARPTEQTTMTTRRPKRTWGPILLAVFGLGVIFLLIVGIKGFQIRKMMSMKPPMPVETVSSATVKEADWPPILYSVGTISPVQGATVATELGGTVTEVGFENGAMAKKGDILIKLDASSEEAQLRSADADAELAKADVERSRDLATRKVISKAELDAAEAKAAQKIAQADNMRAMISKKEIRAPFDGQLGIRQVNIGQMINAGQLVVQIQALDSVYVDFALPQQRLVQLTPGLNVRVTTDAVSDRKFEGKLSAINPAVDPVTRNVTVQALLENKDHTLRPGMFAKVEVVLPEQQKTLIIPGSAVSYAPFGDSVFVIEKKKDEKTGKESEVLRQQFVRIGEARGDFVSVTKGLKAGEVVVGTGVFKLRNGMAVTIKNDLAPNYQENPKPADT